ncbi:MAG: anti-sigma factor RsbA family regulatory protein [Acidothermaceae bacterium]
MSAVSAAVGGDAFLHYAFFYDNTDEYVGVTSDFVSRGVDAGEAVLVAVPTPRYSILRDCEWSRHPRVELLDMSELGRNPGRIISLWQDFVSRSVGGGGGDGGGGSVRGVRGIGEPVWAGRSAAELVECHWHEQLLNLAFADVAGFPLMCPYDVSVLDPEVVEAARRSHPLTYLAGALAPSSSFAGGPRATDDLDVPLDEPPPSSDLIAFGAGQLSAVRRIVFEYVTQAGLSPHRTADVLVAVNEVATNSLRHGGGHGEVRVWLSEGAVVCEVRDGGRIGQALVGRVRSSLGAMGGRGLWLVHQLCDFVEIRSGEGGTTVRMSFYLPG